MKKQLLTILFCIAAMCSLTIKSNGQVLIHYWSFNSFDVAGTKYYFDASAPPAIVAPDFTAITSPTANFVYKTVPGTSAVYLGYYDDYPTISSDYDTVNLRMGDTAGISFRARNPNDSSEILLYMPTTGYKNLVLNYACQKSSEASGDSFNVFSYSTDSGSTWKTSGTGLSEWQDSGSLTFRRITVAINDTSAYNTPKFVFRITFSGNASLTTGGNNRIDNISLDGDTLPGTRSHVGIYEITPVVKYSVYPNPTRNTLNVTSNNSGDKAVIIYNVIGQSVYEGEMKQNAVINTSAFATGLYYLHITDAATSEISVQKFLKQ